MAGLEGALRAVRATPHGSASDWIGNVLLLAVAITGAGGLGLLVGGARPREPLHFVYAILAIGLAPTAAWLARRATPRQQGLITLTAAIVVLAVIARLFQTG